MGGFKVYPHTTDMLWSVYPKVVPGFHIDVKNYLEVLAEHPREGRPCRETPG